jgi:hypothetical protein
MGAKSFTGIDLECLVVQLDSDREIASLCGDCCQQLQRIKVPWLRLQHLFVNGFRLIQQAALMHRQGSIQIGGLPRCCCAALSR